MSSLTKGVILLVVVLGVGAGLVLWKNRVGGHAPGALNRITKEEIELLLADVAKVNPMILKRFKEDPELKKQQLDNLKQLLAFASQAQREGMGDAQPNRQELENIRSEVVAVNYDKEINKDKGPMPPFGFITEDRVKQFWGKDEYEPKGFFASLKNSIGFGPAQREREFQKFLESKVALMKKNNPQMKDRELSEEEQTQAREFFAKIEIYEDEYDEKKGNFAKEFRDKVDLQVKLQQAQFLAREYSDKLAEKVKVTDEDIAKYIAEHGELDVTAKKARAEDILNRAKSGEDFAALANEFSEDPGNKDPATGKGNGGLYAETPKGRMVAPFEQAALSIEAGQIFPDLVETDYGYHIIKLEKRGEGKDPSGQPTETYDVRHILISTGVKDPQNPIGREMPVKAYVRQKLEAEKEKQLIEEIVAVNNVHVPEDFEVPEVSNEQMQEMMRRQMPPDLPEGGETENQPEAKTTPKKADPKKKK